MPVGLTGLSRGGPDKPGDDKGRTKALSRAF